MSLDPFMKRSLIIIEAGVRRGKGKEREPREKSEQTLQLPKTNTFLI